MTKTKEKPMRAAVLHGVGDLRIEDRENPEPGPGQVLARVAAVGVCGSDVYSFEHARIGSYVIEAPLILGHETAGVVAATGAGVSRVEVGDRISIEPGVPDFTCSQCLAGR